MKRRREKRRVTVRELERRLRRLAWATWEASTLLHFYPTSERLHARTLRALAEGRPLPRR